MDPSGAAVVAESVGVRVMVDYFGEATSKSATVLNYCGIGPELVPFVCDSTPGKQGRMTPGTRIPIRAPEAFVPHPDYALLFAWNHAYEIMAKERAFTEGAGAGSPTSPRCA
ncbi:methyltransferase C-terminal domain-containing protein [Nocardiopsis sp. NPDC058631]|uniref:methyltransferase C-terminal domain-containing protein n=1 Tax=Nocardiopsis sp. NPDC058631 TaxID=3346566 RepID=UPI0036607A70